MENLTQNRLKVHSLHLVDCLVNLQFIALNPHIDLYLDVLDEDVADSLVKLRTLQLLCVEVDDFLQVVDSRDDVIPMQQQVCLSFDVSG